jgi:mono/diheme cytochrome c family protein
MQSIWLGPVIAAAAAIHPVNAQTLEAGKTEYLKSCQACHGAGGKGDGPRANNLSKRPSDLTKLSETNNGVFPFVRVYEVIDGRLDVVVHGERNMPVWGDLYRREVRSRLSGNPSDDLVEQLARRRILELVEYVSTLQRK